MRNLLLFLAFCLAIIARAQTCTFDFSNEGWTASVDAVNLAATWKASGGMPGGYIEGVDSDQGGTWYFIAPDKFTGPKCDAYGRFLRYDQFVNTNGNPNNKPDVELIGDGITLVFDNPVLPGTNWTHFDLLLREDAGWRINTLNGATPTQVEFKRVLSNVTSLKIRGEYFAFGSDYGGLDNVSLESEITFKFDLDGDDSSGATGGDYQTAPSCLPFGQIIDADALLETNLGIDSIQVQISGGNALERLLSDTIWNNILIRRYGSGKLTLINTGNASAADFLAALQQIQYYDTAFEPQSGTRIVKIQAYTNCGTIGEIKRAYIPIYLQPDAGLDADTTLCSYTPAFDLRLALNGDPDDNGRWEPLLASGNNLFQPGIDTPGVYQYILPSAEPCSGDTSRVRIRMEYPFELPPDSTICYDEVLYVPLPPGLRSWTWSDGSHQIRLPVREPGVYTLTGTREQCTFSDSIEVSFYTCTECYPFPPNVFSPNDDGLNDFWHIFLYCRWTDYHLEVYDRWGSQVFAADDPEQEWDGTVRGQQAQNGVYVWRMFWSGELFGQPKTWRYEGDVTILR